MVIAINLFLFYLISSQITAHARFDLFGWLNHSCLHNCSNDNTYINPVVWIAFPFFALFALYLCLNFGRIFINPKNYLRIDDAGIYFRNQHPIASQLLPWSAITSLVLNFQFIAIPYTKTKTQPILVIGFHQVALIKMDSTLIVKLLGITGKLRREKEFMIPLHILGLKNNDNYKKFIFSINEVATRNGHELKIPSSIIVNKTSSQ